jgi:hypothetical protein
MGSQLFLFLYTLYHAGNAHLAIAGMPVMGPGRIQMRSIVEGIELGCAFNLPVFPSLSALGRGEAGSYRLPALKLGKLNFCLALLVSIVFPAPTFRRKQNIFGWIDRFTIR